jgi:hypothetical protein
MPQGIASTYDDGVVGARQWLEGSFWFQTGARTRKRRNVARDPRCSVSVHDAGIVLDGQADICDRFRDRRTHCQGLGGQRLASGSRRQRIGDYRPLQRTLGAASWNMYRIELCSAMVVSNVAAGGATCFPASGPVLIGDPLDRADLARGSFRA